MRTKTTSKILSEISEETKEKIRNNANNLISKKMETKTKMTTKEKAEELVNDLGRSHAIYVTEEVIAILEDWEGTELAKKDWVEIKEIVENEQIKANTDKLPDGVLWKKSKEYSRQFAITDKPVQSEIAMNEAQDHYYRGMIASRDMLS